MRWLLFIPFLLTFSIGQGQDSLSVLKKRKAGLLIGSIATYSGSIVALNSIWYSQYERQSFKFFNDSREWKQMDKLGHLYSSYQIVQTYSRMVQWSGFSETKADRIAAFTSFGVMASIEVLDGFSAGYGASASDLAFNSAGIGLYWGQKALWREIRIHPKYSFRRTSYSNLRPEVLGANLLEEIVKDYNGQTQWFSVDLNKFHDHLPKWLNIAVGFGAEGMIYAHDQENISSGLTPYRQVYLGIDFDLSGIRSRHKTVNTLLYILNMIKLPAPTLEISNKKIKGHYFYF